MDKTTHPPKKSSEKWDQPWRGKGRLPFQVTPFCTIFIVISPGHVWLIFLSLLNLKEVRIQRQPWNTPTGLTAFSRSPKKPWPHYWTRPHQDCDFSWLSQTYLLRDPEETFNTYLLPRWEDSDFLPSINIYRDFSGGPVVKNPPSSAGDVGSIPGWGTKIPHATGQLSPHHNYWAHAPQLESLHAANYRAHAPWSPHTTAREEKTCTPQLERSPRTATKGPTYRNKDPVCCNEEPMGASLVTQWLRICLPMQGTQVRALVWEDPTCHGATRPVSHIYWACASGACAPQQERLQQWEARAPRWRVVPTCCN